MSNSSKKQADHAVEAQKTIEGNVYYSGFEVVVADDYTLQLDFDVPWGDPVPMSPKVFSMLMEHQCGFVSVGCFKSKGGNTHVVIRLTNPMKAKERAAWQAALGSDPVREACHMLSIARQELNPILLYMHKNRLR